MAEERRPLESFNDLGDGCKAVDIISEGKTGEMKNLLPILP